jgi:putative ABC transport system permease protein
MQESTVAVGTRNVGAVARIPRKGALPWTMASGRLPTAADEVAVGPRLGHELDVAVGNTLTVRDPAGRPHALRVVGVGMIATDSDTQLGSSMVVTPPTLTQLSTTPGYQDALVRFQPGTAAGPIEDLASKFEIATPNLPVEVRNLRDLGGLPMLLGAFYALVGAAALVHALIVTSRRRVRDLAVLRALGFTSPQVVLTLVVMAVTMVGFGLLLAVPIGVGVGRTVWDNAVTGIGAISPPVVPWWQLAALVAGALLIAVLVACAIALRARPRNPAATLRSE